MVPVSAFFSRLQPQVIGCPEPLAQQALVDSAIEFCEFTQCLVVDLDPINARAGVGGYELDMPSQSRLAQVLRVWFEGRELGAVPYTSVHEVEPLTGVPVYHFCRDADEVLQLNLYPVPDKDAAKAIRVRVATKPARNATSVHASLLEQWADPIVNGAMRRLHEMPGQTFTNEPRALLLESKVRHQLSVARIDALRQRTLSSLTAKMRPFA